ncbi:GerA spore germination protein [Ruminiclostridium papyrosolvens DSM 2782]|uniref:GerA spore germination protein n=1 Tax=Ruminiclostridium papyrosolvens DSM 2782 TaxID=588581 RepID=F1T7Y2_9FIRM|nr:spore germination protein [Ruminiclostridium papyrosolvens]EGD49580.1 GerA spore germination protein [Ruminiclostridium papyrosolvens DSM 2782]WES33294.1 spore germination protein [Ruminiclostridium papyrosolvens DSM 2782]
MGSLFKIIKNLLSYKENTSIEGFELLEGTSEGKDQKIESKVDKQNNVNQTSQSQKSSGQSSKNEAKTPLSVDGWNNVKNKKNKSQQDKKKDLQVGETIAAELKTNFERLKQELNFGKNQDVVIRNLKVARRMNAFIVYIDGMADKTTINNFILRQLMDPEHFSDFNDRCPMDYIADSVLSINEVTKEKYFKKVIMQILSGVTALFIDGYEESLLIESRGYEKRNVDKPVTENVIRGAQEGFTENLRTNITLIRRVIKNKDLITEIIPVGKTDHTSCAMLYIDGIANPAIVNEVKRRINGLDTDFVVGNGILEELIADKPYSFFPQIITTERPDKTAANILDGKVAIIAEGTPFASTVPTSFFEAMQSPEDFFLKWQFGTFLRLLRYLGLLMTLFLPGLYVALTLYHQEMIPTELLTSIAKSRENVPFPTIIEILLMEVSFELIREAGIRVPGAIGNTLGIVGALILGQAAVAANIVSPILIIVVAVGGIGSFTIPSFSLSFTARTLRFVFIFLGGIAGFYGISAGIFVFGCITCGIKSFGVPYFTPVAPKTRANNDLIAVGPIFEQKERPDFVNPLDRKRQGEPTRKWAKKKGEDK